MSVPKSNAKAALIALAGFAVYATHDVLAKTLGAHYSPFQIAFFNVLFAFPLVTLAMIRDTKPGTLLPVNLGLTILRTTTIVIATASAFYAFSVLPLTEAYAILFSMPLIVTILSIPILGESVGIRRWIAVIVGLIGVVIVLQPNNVSLEWGHLAAVVAAFGSSLASVIVRRIGHQERVVVLLLYPMIATFILMGLLMPMFYIPMTLEHLGYQFAMSLTGFMGAFLVIKAYKTGEAVIVAPMQYSQIIWATLFGYFLFQEVLRMNTVLGASVIIASGIYIVLREAKTSSPSKNTPVLRTRSRHEMGTGIRVSIFLRNWKNRKKSDN